MIDHFVWFKQRNKDMYLKEQLIETQRSILAFIRLVLSVEVP